jgi:putative effector of murein hydrolase LrgA (UPF0299 family)
MLLGLFSLLVCQLAGEALAHWLHVPVPGPVIGILLLVAAIGLRHALTGRDATDAAGPVGSTADTLLRNLGLMFVPAGAGIIQSIGLVASNGVAVGVALAGSTIITLVVTVYTFRIVARLTTRRRA